MRLLSFFLFFFFNDTATTEIYTLSLHDALPISREWHDDLDELLGDRIEDRLHNPLHHRFRDLGRHHQTDRKSTRLNSSHSQISYAVFCLKKKKELIIVGSFIEVVADNIYIAIYH